MNVVRTLSILVLVAMPALVCQAQIPVVGGGGANLSAITGTETLVTVILKPNGAKDPNLKVVGVEGGILSVKTQTGQVTSYRVADVQEIRVQGEVMKVRAQDLMADRGLNSDQQEIVSKALAKVSDLFNTSVADQSMRMLAAQILAVGGASGDAPEQTQSGPIIPKNQAIDYLTSLAKGNDVRTSIAATYHLALAGVELPVPTLIADGLASGDRNVKATAAKLAAMTKDKSASQELRVMLQDRAANISAPAALALADLGEKDIIPTLIAMLVDRNPDKATAAGMGLCKLGDANTATELKAKLKDSEGMLRFRIAEVLFALGDKEGGAVLRDELMGVPSLQFDAARVLALKGDVKGMQFMRGWLGQRRDASEMVLTQQALATHALIKAGDRGNAGVLQDVLRDGTATVQVTTLRLISDLDVHALLPMVLPVLNGNDPKTVIVACQTAVSMAHNDYGARLRNFQ